MTRLGLVPLACVLLLSLGAVLGTGDPPDGASGGSDGPLPSIESYRIGHFATSKVCSMCHAQSERATAMRDAEGRGVAPYDLWSASMMANSARDPLWRAAVSAEVAASPERASEIEAKCMRCHAPMATAQYRMHPETEPRIANLRHEDPAVSQLVLDGVSCTSCHQIQDEGLGEERTFSGQYVIGHDQEIYGPHASPVPGPMRMHTGFTPTEGSHVLRSAMCATCHTLVDREEGGHAFYEQSPYQEWQNSIFDDERDDASQNARSCQECHMPRTDREGRAIETRLAHNPGGRDFPFLSPRQPFGRHVFLGGNTLLPRIFQEFSDALGVMASRAQFEAAIEETRAQLQRDTARLEIVRATFGEAALELDVRVQNLTGHKFPTGIPIRRAFLAVNVVDQDGTSHFRSGAFDAQGRLVDMQGDVLPGETDPTVVRPHMDRITDAEQVQVYETRMHDAEGNPTWRLTQAKGYLKDDRLLPLGWSPDHPAAEATRAFGIGDDADFVGGADIVHYRIALPANVTRANVQIGLHYQPLSPVFRADLERLDTAAIRELRGYLERVGNVTETVATASISLAKS